MKTVSRIFDILEVVAANDVGELRLSEICEATGLRKATVNRIVTAMVKRGYMKQGKKRGKYSLNTKLISFNLQNQSYRVLQHIVSPYILRLSELIGESTILAIRQGDTTRAILTKNDIHPLTVNADQISENPMYATSIGKILLAFDSPEELKQYLKTTKLKKFTPNTITDANHLKTHLNMIKREGVAYDDEEFNLGIKGFAVPIRDKDDKESIALGILGPSVRLTRETITRILPEVKLCAKEISNAIIHSSTAE
jgi:IclR family transcriptional regulator, KDG regulon repressor